MHPFHIAWLILAAYGLEALSRRYLLVAGRRTESLMLHLQRWWSMVSGFEKKWTVASLTLVGTSLLALFIFKSWKPHLIEYLVQEGFAVDRAVQIARFSIAEAWWYMAVLLISTAILVGIISGALSGPQARSAWIYLGLIIVLDLARSDTPWIHYFNYKQEYAANSVVDFLEDKPYEHRVTGRLAPKGRGSNLGDDLLVNYIITGSKMTFPITASRPLIFLNGHAFLCWMPLT